MKGFWTEIFFTHGAEHLLIWYKRHGLVLLEKTLSEQVRRRKACWRVLRASVTAHAEANGPKNLPALFSFPLYFFSFLNMYLLSLPTFLTSKGLNLLASVNLDPIIVKSPICSLDNFYLKIGLNHKIFCSIIKKKFLLWAMKKSVAHVKKYLSQKKTF